MSDNNNININTPDIGPYTQLRPFRFWCQKVLPLVYDESLSYYELLCKVVDYLNKTMEDVDQMITDMGDFQTADTEFKTEVRDAYIAFTRGVNDTLERLETYMNNYFNNLDVQTEINNKLDAMAEAGYFSNLFDTLFRADVISEAGTATSTWIAENLLQETGYVLDKSLTVENAAADAKAAGDAIKNPQRINEAKPLNNLLNKLEFVPGYYIDTTTGELAANANYTASGFIPATGGLVYASYLIGHHAFYDSNKEFISGAGTQIPPDAIPLTAAYIRVSIPNANINTAVVSIGEWQVRNPEYKLDYPWIQFTGDFNPEQFDVFGAYYVNLFNKDTVEEGYYVEATTGKRNANVSYFTSDIIPVKENTVYVMNIANRWAAYDSDLQYISGGTLSGTDKEFTTPANAKYIRVSNTPLTVKNTLVVAEKTHYVPGQYESYGLHVPWLKAAKRLSKYEGKNLVCFGDSITNLGYTDAIEADSGINAVNVGLSSGRYAYSDDSDQYVNAFAFYHIIDSINTGDWTIPDSIYGVTGYETQYARIQEIKAIDFDDVDFVSIAYGTNDFSSATPLDNPLDPLDTDTFKGAIRYCLKVLTEKYPALKIIGVTPCYRFWSSDGNILYDSDEHAIGVMYLKDYVDAIEEVFTEYHLPVVNDYDNAGINKYNRLEYFSINDGLHPNQNGRNIIGHRIASGILNEY